MTVRSAAFKSFPISEEKTSRGDAAKYGEPATPGMYDWKTGAAFFVLGTGAAAQTLAEIYDRLGPEDSLPIIRTGRYIGAAGATACGILYLLHRRTSKHLRTGKTSLISVGSWMPATFGLLSGVTAFGQFLKDKGHEEAGSQISRVFGIPAGLAAVTASVYKGTELEGTTVSFWPSSFPLLSPMLSALNAKTAVSALDMVSHDEGKHEAMQTVALISAFLQSVLVGGLSWRLKKRMAKPGRDYPLSPRYGILLAIGAVGPVILRMIQKALPERDKLKALSLAGDLVEGVVLPMALTRAGSRSESGAGEYPASSRPVSQAVGPKSQDNLTRRKRVRPLLGVGLLLAGAAAVYCAMAAKR